MNSTGARAAWWSIVVVLILGIAAATAIGVWQSHRPLAEPADSAPARQEVQDVVKSSVPKLLSYTPDNADTSLNAAKSLLTGEFKENYSDLIDKTVIPAAKEQQITVDAQVAGAAVESLTADNAKLLVFVDQQITKPADTEPDNTQSSVRVGLQKVNGNWLIDTFNPV